MNEPIMELTDEHRDGSIYVDGEGDLWQPYPFGGWLTIHRAPFTIHTQPAEPLARYGPYTLVLPPKPPNP
jgi:hypothetical protein